MSEVLKSIKAFNGLNNILLDHETSKLDVLFESFHALAPISLEVEALKVSELLQVSNIGETLIMEVKFLIEAWCSVILFLLSFEKLPEETVGEHWRPVFITLVLSLGTVVVVTVNVVWVLVSVCCERHGVILTGSSG